MKVITIKQPFATLIAEGIKEYEFRTWKTNYRGELLIHAGKGIDKQEIKKYKVFTYPQGCIIAKANLTDCIKVDDKFREVLKKKNATLYNKVITDKEKEKYAFKLENVTKIEPIFLKGQLGLWNYKYNEEKIIAKRGKSNYERNRSISRSI